MMEFNNKKLQASISKIIENDYPLSKGNISGYSIEIIEPEPLSYTSFIYYENEDKRDEDFEIIKQIKLKKC
jgi:hypothetical protein